MKVGYATIARHPESLRDLIRSELSFWDWEVIEFSYDDSDQSIKDKLKLCDGVLFAPARFLSYDVLKAAEKCKIFQIWSSGYDKFNVDAARKLGIPLCNNGGGNSVSVAEHTIMLILAIYKNLINAHAMTLSGNWSGNQHGMDQFTLEGKTLGLIGLGAIGRGVAIRAKAFGADVIYYDPYKQDNEFEKCSLDSLLNR